MLREEFCVKLNAYPKVNIRKSALHRCYKTEFGFVSSGGSGAGWGGWSAPAKRDISETCVRTKQRGA